MGSNKTLNMEGASGRAGFRSAVLLLIFDFLLSVILVYGYVYAAYKLGNPYFGKQDFFNYQGMIGQPFDFSAAIAPGVIRQIPTLVASAYYRIGIAYDTSGVLDLIWQSDDMKRRYLALILSNATAVILAMVLATSYLRMKLKSERLALPFAVFGIFAGWFWFSSLVIAPLTVGWGWLASVLFAIAFLEQSLAMTVAAAAFAMFSRETTIVFALGLYGAAIVVYRSKLRIFAPMLASLIVAALIYIVMRKAFFHGHEEQITIQSILSSFARPLIKPGFLTQSLLSEAAFLVLVAAVARRSWRLGVCLICGMCSVVLVGIGAHISEFSAVTGETLPLFAIVFLLADALYFERADKHGFDKSGAPFA